MAITMKLSFVIAALSVAALALWYRGQLTPEQLAESDRDQRDIMMEWPEIGGVLGIDPTTDYAGSSSPADTTASE